MKENNPLNIFIGYDPREAIVYHTCVQSIIENTKSLVSIHPLHLDMLTKYSENFLTSISILKKIIFELSIFFLQ